MSQLDLKIGPKIKAFRRQLGLQANKLAEELSISPSYLNLLENNQRPITVNLLFKLGQLYNIDFKEFSDDETGKLTAELNEVFSDPILKSNDVTKRDIKNLANTSPTISSALLKLYDSYIKLKDGESISSKGHTTSFKPTPFETVRKFLEASKNYFPSLEQASLSIRTEAESAKLITSDVDDRDKPYLTGDRTAEGFYTLTPESSFERCVTRGKAYAEYADLIWMETSTPNLEQAKKFSEAIRKYNPDQLLAYNCSPSFNWTANLSKDDIARFQRELGAMGYKFQFITLAGFHTQNIAIFELAEKYKKEGMTAYSRIQEQEFAREKDGYTSVKHQREVGTSYFDAVSNTISSGKSSTTAMEGSTESEQF